MAPDCSSTQRLLCATLFELGDINLSNGHDEVATFPEQRPVVLGTRHGLLLSELTLAPQVPSIASECF